MSYAIIKTGGKQYKVAQGDSIDIEKLDLAEGETATFEEVLCVANGGDIKIGDPTISGATVTGTVVEQRRAKKVTAFKFRRRTGYHKTKGHRQPMTRISITGING